MGESCCWWEMRGCWVGRRARVETVEGLSGEFGGAVGAEETIVAYVWGLRGESGEADWWFHFEVYEGWLLELKVG